MTDSINLKASFDLQFKPTLFEETNGDILLYYSESIIISLWLDRFETDIWLWRLPNGSSTWEIEGIVIEDCATAFFYSVEKAPDGTLFMIYIDAVYSQFWWRDSNVENITIRYKPAGGSWRSSLPRCC